MSNELTSKFILAKDILHGHNRQRVHYINNESTFWCTFKQVDKTRKANTKQLID